MKVLIADKFEESGIQGLKELECEISYQPELKDEALVEMLILTPDGKLTVRNSRIDSDPENSPLSAMGSPLARV